MLKIPINRTWEYSGTSGSNPVNAPKCPVFSFISNSPSIDTITWTA